MMWSDQLNQMTRNLYMDAYLPGNLNTKEGYINADQIINEQLKTLSNSSFIAANQYVGSLASGCENDRFGSSVSISIS